MEKGWTKTGILGDEHSYLKVVDWMGSDELIVESARMSTGRGFVSWEPYERCKVCDLVQQNGITPDIAYESCRAGHDWQDFPRGDNGILESLYRDRHTTPSEMGELLIEVQAPLLVFREWQRHRTQSYNELSARYVQMPNLHYVPTSERLARGGQSKTSKQGAGEMVDVQTAVEFQQDIEAEQAAIYATYEGAIAEGFAKELARLNTPVSRYSRMRAKANLLNWLKFLGLRKPTAAMWEIRQYADVLGEVIKEIWPRTYGLFEEWDLHGVRLGRAELAALRVVLSELNVDSMEVDGENVLPPRLRKILWPEAGS